MDAEILWVMPIPPESLALQQACLFWQSLHLAPGIRFFRVDKYAENWPSLTKKLLRDLAGIFALTGIVMLNIIVANGFPRKCWRLSEQM